MPAEQSPHLVIPFASCSGEAWLQAMKSMPKASTANLGKLLQGMKLVHTDEGEAFSLSAPHERVLARAHGLVAGGSALVDGLIPWAAAQAAKTLGASATSGRAWAFITPCHWAMGREHATLTDPSALALTSAESQILMAAMQPYFATEGITLHYAEPYCWLAEAELFRQLATASLDRVLGRNVDTWLPGAKTAPSLRRLQNEMQMLLYTHPLNDERTAHRQLSVNSFWLSGTGALGQPLAATPEHLNAPRTLAQAAFTDDWAAYASAWTELDAGKIAQLLAQQRKGQTVRLSLCGESNALTFKTAPRSFFAQISSFLAPQPAINVLEQL
jgi:hypothetical protein